MSGVQMFFVYHSYLYYLIFTQKFVHFSLFIQTFSLIFESQKVVMSKALKARYIAKKKKQTHDPEFILLCFSPNASDGLILVAIYFSHPPSSFC